MRLVICGPSAVEILRSTATAYPDELHARSIRHLTSFNPIGESLSSTIGRTDGVHQPLHLLFDEQGMRRPAKNVICHCAFSDTRLPKESFLEIGDEVYIPCAELAFLDMASYCTPLELARIGMDLCGCYRVMQDRRTDLVAAEPLTSAARINAYLKRMPSGTVGLKKATTVAAWLTDNSASPRETSLAVCMRVPSRVGGYQVRSLELNLQIPLSSIAAPTTTASYFVGDAVDPSTKTVIEYNSSKHHDDEGEHEYDMEKITALGTMGYHVIPITTRQFNRFDAFDAIMTGNVIPHLGIRRGAVVQETLLRRREAHRTVLAAERQIRKSPSLADLAWWQVIWTRYL